MTEVIDEAPLGGALAPWFGAKRTIAPAIVAELGPHVSYWDVFVGSMAVTFAKPPSRMETVNDLNGDIVNLARTLRHPVDGPRLYRRLRRTLTAAAEFRTSAAVILESPFEPTAERAYHYFVFCWLGRSGDAGTTKSGPNSFCKRYTKNGGHAAVRFNGAVDTIPAFRRRLRGLTILNEDAFGLLERIEDAEKVTVYEDPPYVVKGAKYVHDAHQRPAAVGDAEWSAALELARAWPGLPPAEVAWHACLAARNRRFARTRVVVSYYDHPLVRHLYAGWTVRPIAAAKAMVNSTRRGERGTVAAPEILLINGPSLVEPADTSDRNLFPVN